MNAMIPTSARWLFWGLLIYLLANAAADEAQLARASAPPAHLTSDEDHQRHGPVPHQLATTWSPG